MVTTAVRWKAEKALQRYTASVFSPIVTVLPPKGKNNGVNKFLAKVNKYEFVKGRTILWATPLWEDI
jgi:hypothetical protein